MKPIIFSTEMVRAIQDNLKTQTRRVIKPQPEWVDEVTHTNYIGGIIFPNTAQNCQCGHPIVPRYAVGDILYVRETWQPLRIFGRDLFAYRADKDVERHLDGFLSKWKPSIHMPKAAARIFLSVTKLKVERIQDITVDDCIAEGVNNPCDWFGEHQADCNCLEVFADIWTRIHGKDAWERNDWVAAYTFERCEKPEE